MAALPKHRQLVVVGNGIIAMALVAVLLTASTRTPQGAALGAVVIALTLVPIATAVRPMSVHTRVLAFWIAAGLMAPFAIAGVSSLWGLLVLVAVAISLFAASVERERG